MHAYPLDTFLAGHVFAFMLLLSRVGAVLMLFPGIGEHYVAARTRMILACTICLLLLGPMLPRLPALPTEMAEMVRLIGYEIVVGIFFGTLVRLLIGALEAAGMVVGIHTGLSNATMMNPALATQSPLSGAFLSTAGLALIFVTDLDHFLFRSTVALYDTFPPGGAFVPGDMAQTVIRITGESFATGIQMAAPFIIMGMLLYAGVGVLQRLMPSVQLFMIMMPIEIWGGLMMLSLTMAGIMTFWLQYFDHTISSFFG